MIINDLIKSVITLFILMLPGFIMKKASFTPEGFGKGLSNLVLYIANPILVLYSFLSFSGGIKDIWLDAVLVLLLSVVAHTLFAVVSVFAFKKAPEAKRRLLELGTVFSNAAFMGIPLIEMLLGSEAAIYASIYNIPFNFFLWTLGVHLCTSGREGDKIANGRRSAIIRATRKVLLHPTTISSAIGIILLAVGANKVVFGVEIIADSLAMIKGLVAPLSMIVIGIRLADINFRGFFNDVYMYAFLMLRHLLLPLAVVGVMKAVELCGVPLDETVYVVTAILAATPAASSATMFAEMYDCDALYASRLVAVSTILCIATMPLIVMIAQL